MKATQKGCATKSKFWCKQMVSVTISRKKLFELLGSKAPALSDEQLASELEQIKCGFEAVDEKSDEITLEVTPDRPDLLSVYGIARALKGRLEIEVGLPMQKLSDKHEVQIFAEKDALAYWPFVVGAVVRGVKFSEPEIAQLFQTQEKLDMTLGRKRKRASIGLYDLDALKPPFYFRALDSNEAKFTPLKAERPMSLRQILEQHPTGKEYAHLLGGSGRLKLPVLQDSEDGILALIPIVNSISGAVIPATRNLFIDLTGTDEHACNAALNIFCQDFEEMGAEVSKVEVVYPGKTTITPLSMPHSMSISLENANKSIGMQLSAKEAVKCLERQRISATVEGSTLHCKIPAYRGDFQHWADLAEEIAIGYGFNNFEPRPPTTFTRGSLSPSTLKENFVRDFAVGAGFTELSTYAVTSEEKVRRAKSTEELAEILNPVSDLYTAVRATILPNLLEVLSENTHNPYPQKIFELGEVITHNAKLAERLETKLHLCVISCHAQANLTEVASVLNELEKRLGTKISLRKLEENAGGEQFIPGRAGEIVLEQTNEKEGKVIGRVGEIHPAVLEKFGIQLPASAFEVEIPV